MNTIQSSVLPFYNKDHLSPLPNNMFLVFTQDLIRMTFTKHTSMKILPRVVCPRCACSLSPPFCESSLELPRAARQRFQLYFVPCESHFPISRLLLQQYPISLYQLLSYSAATIAKYHCLGGSATDTISNSPGVEKLPNHITMMTTSPSIILRLNLRKYIKHTLFLTLRKVSDVFC